MTNQANEYWRRICRAIDFLNKHQAKNPSVAEIAKAAPFSSFHFQRLFRALTGESVAEFARRVKLETAARHLLFRRQDDVTQIAFNLGFSSSQNLAKAFKKHFGTSPTQFRKQHQIETETEMEPFDWKTSIDWKNSSKSRLNSAIKVVQLPATRVAYRRRIGSYRDAGVEAQFDSLIRWGISHGFEVEENCIGIPWDDADVTTVNKCRFDACLIVPDDFRMAGINFELIPAGRYAVLTCEVRNHDFESPWTTLMRDWLPASGYQPTDGPRFERYRSDGSNDPLGRWKLEIYLPVQPL